MNAYGSTAVEAAKRCASGAVPDPVTEWSHAVCLFLPTLEGQKKSCPKSTFLGLCEEGLVHGIPWGTYTRSRSNKHYALLAVQLLRRHPNLINDSSALWRAVMAGEEKRPNGQMDVVIALWKAELLCVD